MNCIRKEGRCIPSTVDFQSVSRFQKYQTDMLIHATMSKLSVRRMIEMAWPSTVTQKSITAVENDNMLYMRKEKGNAMMIASGL